MPGMDIARTQIPYLPPDWTVGRSLKYAAKLAAFIVVPGLHQIASKRRILGGLLFVSYVVAEVCRVRVPVEFTSEYFVLQALTFASAPNISEAIRGYSWLLLAFDVRSVDKRPITLNSMPIIAIVSVTYLFPSFATNFPYIHVVQNNALCPTFCRYDIVEYDFYIPADDDLSVGDHVIVDDIINRQYLTTILAGPPKDACKGDERTVVGLPLNNPYCESFSDPRYWYLVPGGPTPQFPNVGDRGISMVSEDDVDGIRPRKIGNTHQYFLVSEGTTDYVGNALLILFKWTGLNPFDASN